MFPAERENLFSELMIIGEESMPHGESSIVAGVDCQYHVRETN